MTKGTELPTYAFIDGQNLHQSIKEQGWILDHKKFRVYLKDKLGVSKAFYFVGFLKRERLLYSNLKKSGYSLIFKKTLQLNSGEVKGNVDAELVLNTMVQYHNFSQAVIVAGDGDYYCLLEYLKKTNKLRSLVLPNKRRYSSLLRRFGNKRLFINDLRKKLEYVPIKKMSGSSAGQNHTPSHSS